MIRVMRNLLLLTVLAMLALPVMAQASGKGAFKDCNYDGVLDKKWSNSELRDALDLIPSDRDEYANCREIIENALVSGSDNRNNNPPENESGGGGNGSGGGGGGNGGGGSVTAEEQQAQAKDNADLNAITGNPDDKPEVTVGDERVEPGANGLFDLASASNDIPLPLLLALIAIGVLALGGGLVALRGRVPAIARIPLVSKIPRVSIPRLRR